MTSVASTSSERARSPQNATRWMQLTLVEDDPKDFDAALWRQVFIDSQSNATCLSAGGYIAYYPSDIEFHHVSKWIGDTDPFGELVTIARELDMHIIARIDPHAIHADAAAAHPEWVQVLEDGTPREHWAYPGVFVTCALNTYNFEFMTKVVREIGERYDIDAIFANRWAGHQTCYCEACRTGFRAATGHDIPGTGSGADVWAAWREWRRITLTRLVRVWDQALKEVRPHSAFIPNIGANSFLDFDPQEVAQFLPFLFVDHQGRTGIEAHWSAGRNGKRMRGIVPDKPIGLIASVGPEERHRWKDAVTNPPEIKAWLADGIAHGQMPWCTKFGGRIPDRRWLAPINEAFDIFVRLEDAYAGTRPTAEIAVLDPSSALRALDPNDRPAQETHGLGIYHALVEARLPFELLSDLRLDAESLKPFKVLVIPSGPRLSRAQIDDLRAFVAGGGSVIAAYDTGLYDETGTLHGAGSSFDALFGMARGDAPTGFLKNTYLALQPEDEGLSAGIEETDRIIGGTRNMAFALTDPTAVVPFRFFPAVPDLPMEEVFARGESVEPAAVFRHHPGGGRTGYFGFDLGAVFWDVLQPDHQRLIENAVRWALGAPACVAIEGDGLIDVAMRRSADTVIVTVVNLTNEMALKGPVRANRPIGPVTVRLRGETAAADTAALLVGGGTAAVTTEDGALAVTLDRLELIETIVFRVR